MSPAPHQAQTPERFLPQTHGMLFVPRRGVAPLSGDSSHGPSSLVGRHCGKSVLAIPFPPAGGGQRRQQRRVSEQARKSAGLSEGGRQGGREKGRQTEHPPTHPSTVPVSGPACSANNTSLALARYRSRFHSSVLLDDSSNPAELWIFLSSCPICSGHALPLRPRVVHTLYGLGTASIS